LVTLTGRAVAIPNFSISTNPPTSQTVTPGQAANYSATLVPFSGFTGTVVLKCSGVPDSTCSVTPNSVSLASGGATVQVAVVTAGTAAGLMQPNNGSSASGPVVAWTAMIGALGTFLVLVSVRRRSRPNLFYSAALSFTMFFAIAMPGCGGSGSRGGSVTTPNGTYTVTVTGTSGSGSSQLGHDVTFTLLVQ
jgi:hypothetical protein